MENLTSLIGRFNNSSWLNLIFLLLAVISIAISIILYLKNKRQKKPCYYFKQVDLIKNSLSEIRGIEIKYNDNPIQNLTMTRLVLYNKGNDTINKDDVAPKDPLRIMVGDECKILSSEIVYSQKEANNFSLRFDADNNQVLIDFDYFHRNEGIIVQLYHTGSEINKSPLKGTIKGVSEIQMVIPDADLLTDKMLDILSPIFNPIYKYITFRPLRLIIIIPFVPIVAPLLILDILVKPFRTIPKNFTMDLGSVKKNIQQNNANLADAKSRAAD